MHGREAVGDGGRGISLRERPGRDVVVERRVRVTLVPLHEAAAVHEHQRRRRARRDEEIQPLLRVRAVLQIPTGDAALRGAGDQRRIQLACRGDLGEIEIEPHGAQSRVDFLLVHAAISPTRNTGLMTSP
jgi:hypothetical protein